ncbi:MAG: metallophosphoesterase [bacterium]|nr:metallophosphoesterase [bacterium]
MKDARKHLLIPDVQDGPDRPKDHLTWISNYIAAKQPDVIVQIGDLADFASLSSYDKGKASIEGKRLTKDWDSFRRALDMLEARYSKIRGYKPRKVFTEGNHEVRVKRYANDNAQVDTLPDVLAEMRARGWEAYPFMDIVAIDGIRYSHLFARTTGGKVTNSSQRFGAPSSLAQVRANMVSCTAGHRPGFDYGEIGVEGRTLHGLIAGSCYLHRESYETAQGGRYFRGIVVKHEVKNGEYDLMKVSLDYLGRKYAGR